MSEMHAYRAPEIIRECTKDVLIDIIDYNYENKPKPHHMNKELMTTVLKMEREDD